MDLQREFSELLATVKSMDQRLRDLERRINGSVENTQPEIDPELVTAIRQTSSPPPLPMDSETPPERSSNFLGYVGMGCLILAMILLIRFSIESGWLTPARQIVLAAVFGGILIYCPRFIRSSEKSYIALLPAAGVVILHLTVYGGVFYHHLISLDIGLALVSGIGLLSLWLLNRYQEETYGLLAIAGTYLGCFLLHNALSELPTMGLYLLAWDLIFSLVAINLKNRPLITFASYAGLGLVSLMSLTQSLGQDQLAQHLAILQIAQMLIFAVATGSYSVKHGTTLKEKEAWSLFPIFLFFYGQEYYLFNLINENYATIFSLFFIISICSIYYMAIKRLKQRVLESAGAVFTLVSLVAYHSLFFGIIEDVERIHVGLGLMLLSPLLLRLDERFVGVRMLTGVVIAYCMAMVMLNPTQLTSPHLAALGFVYGILCFIGYGLLKHQLLQAIASLHFMVAIYRFIPSEWISPAWVLFSLGLIIIGMKRSDKALSQTALPIIFIAMARFLFVHFFSLDQGMKIISLIVMGAMIFLGGLVYKQTKDKEPVKAEI